MAGPSLLKSDIDRRLAVNAAKAMFDESESLAARGELRSALVLMARANGKLAEVVESLLDRGTTT
jgi:hypothetical protein